MGDLYMRQRVFSWGDKFEIYDSAGNVKYYVEGEVFTFGKKLHLYDVAGNELAYIEQKIFTFLPKYFIHMPGREPVEIVKEFTFFKPEYSVYGPDWKVVGDFWDHDYEVCDGKAVVAHVYKEWFTWGDAYAINFGFGADEVMALSVVLVIDACIEAQRNN